MNHQRLFERCDRTGSIHQPLPNETSCVPVGADHSPPTALPIPVTVRYFFGMALGRSHLGVLEQRMHQNNVSFARMAKTSLG
ncbi:MAG: hypothetical protein AAGA83_17750 [Cyanobacteria bacterium P01_F01_bin.116]